MRERIVLCADEGKVLTNGTTYGTVIYLAENADKSEYYEISQAEYDEYVRKEAEKAEAVR